MIRLLLLLTIVPAVELFVLLQLGAWMGPGPTLMLIVLTGVVGATLARREGFAVMTELQQKTAAGEAPTQSLVEGILILVGGLLLLTPGIFTDLFGFSLVVPATRKLLAPAVIKAFQSAVNIQTFQAGAPYAGRPDVGAWAESPPPPSSPTAHFDHPEA